jgi:hypothetical protein
MDFTDEDLDRALGFTKRPDKHVPEIRFDIPKLTPDALVNAVQNDRPIWKLLSQAALEDEAAKQAKKLSDRYDQTPIPAPEFETEDWHL